MKTKTANIKAEKSKTVLLQNKTLSNTNTQDVIILI